MSQRDHGPLRGVRILDLTRALAGPYASGLLADMGADVIKIENPSEPDGVRTSLPRVNGVSNHFMNFNRNKRSLPIDLSVDQGRELFLKLVATADVVVENFRPGVMDNLGLSYETLSVINDQIILCSISGFGQTGSFRANPAYDVIVQAMSGAMSVTGEPGGEPVRLGVPMGDLSGGLFGAIGILSALHDRSVSGKGQSIDVSMLDGLTHLMLYYSVDYLNAGLTVGPVGGRHNHIAPYGVLPVSDGHLVVAIITKKFWLLFCEAIERPDLIVDERFLTTSSRLKNKDELYSILDEVLKQRTQAEWTAIFEKASIPFAPMLTVDQVAEHPLFREREMFVETVHPVAGPVWITGRPIKFPNRDTFEVSPAPELGEHSGEVLRELLGLDAQEIETLRTDGVIV
jgi:crotonobetainyl-CoA:carnitine CoA-transferase CaiB-like acyl-CoA transferase